MSSVPSPAPQGWRSPHNLLRLSVVVALLTIVLKTLAWWLTGSVGLLSDALESFVNLAGAMFALAMVTVAQRPADAGHPSGHHKAEYFSAGFEGILVVGAGLAILVAGVARWLSPQPLEQLGGGLLLSLLSTACNGALAWSMHRSARQYRSMALEGDARHLMSDVYTSLGVVAGLALAGATGWLWLDPLVAVLVALGILYQGARLVWQSAQGLMDEALPAAQRQAIAAVLAEQAAQMPGQLLFDNIVTRGAGARSFVDLHMHVPGGWSLAQAAQWRAQTERALLQAVPGLYVRIELLPTGMATASEVEVAAPAPAQKDE